jgi:hypothetical protein
MVADKRIQRLHKDLGISYFSFNKTPARPGTPSGS